MQRQRCWRKLEPDLSNEEPTPDAEEEELLEDALALDGARREEYHTGWKMERVLSKAGPAAKEERSAEEVRPAMEAAPRSKEEIAGMGHRESWTL